MVAHGGALLGWFDDEWHWMADPDQAGYGAFGDAGSHAVDLVLWLLGYRADVRRVNAWTGTVTHRYSALDGLGSGTIEFDDGTVATVYGSWIDLANPIQLTVVGAPPPQGNSEAI